MSKTIELSKEAVDAWDLTGVVKYASWCKNAQYFNREGGKEHYRLIGYLAHQIGGEFFVDIGTYMGLSALALSTVGKKVVTYDVCDWIPDPDVEKLTVKTKDNVEFRIANCLHDMDELAKSDFIVLDIDPHDGGLEPVIMDALDKHGFKGVLFLDDIGLNADMKLFWNGITQKKYDATKYGHWSGSGVVVYDPSRFDFTFE